MTNAIKIAVLAVAGLTLAACGTTESGYSDKGSRQVPSGHERRRERLHGCGQRQLRRQN